MSRVGGRGSLPGFSALGAALHEGGRMPLRLPTVEFMTADLAGTRAAPGVVAIYTGEDLTGVNGLPCGWLITGTDGQPMKEPPHWVLAKGKVCYVGDGVAMEIGRAHV